MHGCAVLQYGCGQLEEVLPNSDYGNDFVAIVIVTVPER
jgi:hypothetical protein